MFEDNVGESVGAVHVQEEGAAYLYAVWFGGNVGTEYSDVLVEDDGICEYVCQSLCPSTFGDERGRGGGGHHWLARQQPNQPRARARRFDYECRSDFITDSSSLAGEVSAGGPGHVSGDQASYEGDCR
jgi:hypothetical protein